MRLTKFSHSCLRLERDGAVLVIDPGAFSEAASLDGVDAVLITHEHTDHLDVDKLADALDRRPGVRIYTHADVIGKLGAVSEIAQAVSSGQTFEAAGFEVRAFGGWHAMIYPELPAIPNLGFLIDGVYHPGDSFDVPDVPGIDTLFVPVSAPWLKLSESIDFVRAVRPRRAFALHDVMASDIGLGLVNNLISGFGGTEYSRLAPGETIDA